VTEAEFFERMEAADQELARKDLPVHQRSLHAFMLMAPGYNGPMMTSPEKAPAFPPFVGPRLLASINDWYERRYGKVRMTMPTIGRIPLEIKGQVFLAVIPVAYGSPRLTLRDIFSFIEHFTPDMAASLTQAEQMSLAQRWLRGYELMYEMEDLQGGRVQGGPALFASAVLDRNAAVRALDQHHPDLANASFHAQQLAEKALKAYLVTRAGFTEKELKDIGHKLEDLATRCEKESPDFIALRPDIALLKTITMAVRYTPPAVRPQEAAEMIWAALRVAGLAACKILDCERRFKP
jgi:HEPN domain-containing protein